MTAVRLAALGILLAAPWSYAGSAGEGASPESAAGALPQTTGRIATISIERTNVFDPSVPGEDWWPFRIANRIHILTRERVVAREALLRPGDPWQNLKALETERNLRSLGFIRHADMRPMLRPDGRLDVGIRTQDSWTLAPQLGVGTEGGEHFFVSGVREGNLLGFGKEVSFFHSEIGSETRNELRYVDPRVLNTWQQLTSHYSKTSRGDEIGVMVHRPFFSFETRHAMDVSWARVVQENTLYQNADDTTEFLQDFRTVRASVGRRLGDSTRLVQRASVGTLFARSLFTAADGTTPGTLPEDRTLSGPVFGYSWIQPRYLKEINIDRMQRVEDFNLGNELSLSAGPMLRSWGSDRDRWVFTALSQQGLGFGPGRFALAQVGANARAAGGAFENALLYANLNLFWKPGWAMGQTLVGHVEFNTTRRLDGEKQIILGGDSGLRGYKNNSFTGGRSILFNFEDRLFLDREFFHLLYLGGVAFVDAGHVTREGGPLALDSFKSDVGFGLRLSPSRSTSGGVLRLDLAYALNGGPGNDRWVATLRAGQAFDLLGSASRSALRSPDAVLAEGSATDRLRRR
ncbi:MAG: hypothetical protein ABII00_16940 [Elusimicrobiota bacterium]